MKWAKSLILADSERVESRLASVFKEMKELFGNVDVSISYIDATGPLGNSLTKRNNDKEEILLTIEDLILLAEEEGQIIELELSIIAGNVIRILVTDGRHIDVLGNDAAILPLIGRYNDLNPELFTN